ncbi:MAG: zinc ribbon domain-containing protein [Bacteroidetes bacterium]|nr:zinc ribbon domain-containing protein [Bacteroidota bacterium]
MILCKNCGVELEENMKNCPLCGKHISEESPDDEKEFQIQETRQEERLLSDFRELTPIQRRRLFWQLSAMILLSGMIVTFIIDLIINKDITWSKYTMSSCLALFLIITMIVFLKRKIIVSLTGSFIITSILMVLFDMFNKNIGWGTKLGIPLVFAFYLVVFVLISLVRRSRQRGINLIALFLIASGILSVCIEGIISLQINNRLNFQWSVIALVSVLPVSAILLFIHYRLRKGTDLKRFFHI